MAGTATVKVIVLGDASKARKALQGLSGDVDKSRSKFSGFGKGLATFGKMAGGALLSVAGASAIAGGAALKMGLDYSNMKDSSMVAFESMLGSAADAKKMWKDVVQFANSTPFDTGTVVNLSKQLLALGKSQKQIIPTIRNIGDLLASQGVSGDAAARAMTAYTQIVGKGKVSMEEINQLAEAGVVIFPALARELGVSQKKAREMVTAGEVDAATFERAWATAAEKTGGAMDKQARTLQGRWSTLKDTIGSVFGEFVNSLAPDGASGLELLTKKVSDFGTFLNGTVAPAIRNFIKEAQTPGTGTNTFFKTIGDGIKRIGDAINFAKPYVKDFKDNYLPGLKSAWHDITTAFNENKGTFQGIGTALTTIGKAIIQYVLPAIGKLDGAQLWALGKAAGYAIRSFADFARATIDMSVVALRAFGFLYRGWAGTVDAILILAEKALGWIPGWGDKIRAARGNFDRFSRGITAGTDNAARGLGALRRSMDNVPDKKRVKLEADKRDAEAKIANINRQLRQKIPAAKRTKLLADKANAIANLSMVQHKLNQLPRSKTVTIYVSAHAQTGRITVAGQRVNIGQFASGTSYAPGGLAMVGEEGPELVELPKGSKVHTAPKTAAMKGELQPLNMGSAGGGNTYVNFYIAGSVISEKDLIEKIRAGLQRVGNRNGGVIFAT